MPHIAVLRDTSTGDCALVNVGYDRHNLDTERVEESPLELAGWLQEASQYQPGLDTECSCEDEDSIIPCFTTCQHVIDDSKPEGDDTGRICGRLIMIIDGGAPDHCSDHPDCTCFE